VVSDKNRAWGDKILLENIVTGFLDPNAQYDGALFGAKVN
jgi:hypothetical protein